MCMCMSLQARWKMVHCSYLYVLSVSVTQAGVTCMSFSNYTAWKWQLEKKNHDLAPELTAYALMRSFSHASHQCGRGSPCPITVVLSVTGLKWSQYYSVSVPIRGRYKCLDLRVHITQVLYDRSWQLKVRQHVVDELVTNWSKGIGEIKEDNV